MKHLLLILTVLVIAYVLWHIRPKNRQIVTPTVRRHLLRLIIAVTILFALFFAAVQNSSIQLF